MDAQSFFFWVFAALSVFSAIRVVTARNPVHSALFLVLTFFTMAGIWMLLRAEFLAITLVLVYVGAVMVLFLFVVMMLDINLDQMRQGFWRNLPVALFVGVAIVLELAIVLAYTFSGVAGEAAPALPADYSNTRVLGSLIYTDYVYPFEIASVLLLVAMIAAIALTLRKRKDTRTNDPFVAIQTRAGDRVRMAVMPKIVRQRGPVADAAKADQAAPGAKP